MKLNVCRVKQVTAGLLLVLSCAYTNLVQAALDIELTEGVSGTIPVMVMGFQGQGYHAADPQNITAVIEHDFNHSDKLKALLIPDATTQTVVSSKSGADYVLTGVVKPLGDGRFEVTSVLRDLSHKSAQSTWLQAPIVFSETYTAHATQFRALAHRISDRVYLKVTGERGIFSTKVAYVNVKVQDGKRKYSLEVSDYDGFNPKVILSSLHPIMSPAWSPDGKKLAYVSFEKGRSEIYISQIMDGRRERVSNFPGINGAPAWSNDGRKLALALSKNEAQPHIYVMDLATKALSQVTKGWSIDTEPAWSSDGQRILFTSDRGGNPQIYQVSLMPGAASSSTPERLTYEGNYNSSASYLPDGKQILLLHRASKDFNIALLDMSSNRVFQLTQVGTDESPSAAPNGNMVLYATRDGDRGILSVISTDGRVKWSFPVRSGSFQEPAWSPFLN